ncbi:hypothetical protein MFLAVUS_005272 [Mucor flavus]|uniref:Uncharacterized protein n=1 Tax=Mucor flavus TaxID=439312 RepID=A0ABP9YY81_9FUNG
MTSIRSLLRGEKDIDEMLYEVQLDKISIIKGKLRPSALVIVEEAIEDSQLWNEEGDEQEITFYRHFTSYLGTLLRNTTLKIMENPAVLATRRFADIACIENTLLALFKLKPFYMSLIPALREIIATQEMYTYIEDVYKKNATVEIHL